MEINSQNQQNQQVIYLKEIIEKLRQDNQILRMQRDEIWEEVEYLRKENKNFKEKNHES